jgi:uncharacterized membrane protein SirB2
MVLGGGFLIAFSAGFFGLYSLRQGWLSAEGLKERIRRMKWWTSLMAVVSTLTVITGTWIVYPWYRAPVPEGTADLAQYPRNFLLADPNLANWHSFGMEWKEHVAWLSPILAVAVAYIVIKYGPELAKNEQLRRIAIVLFVLAFVSAAVAGLMGAFITKAAPII